MVKVYDLTLDDDGDIKTDDSLDTNLLMSLYCDKRASENEVPHPERRRGWIGNESTEGFEIGSKLWLFKQERLTRTTINTMNSIVRESLQWLIDDGLAKSVESSIVFKGDDQLTVEIVIIRFNGKIDNIYYPLWENTGT